MSFKTIALKTAYLITGSVGFVLLQSKMSKHVGGELLKVASSCVDVYFETMVKELAEKPTEKIEQLFFDSIERYERGFPTTPEYAVALAFFSRENQDERDEYIESVNQAYFDGKGEVVFDDKKYVLRDIVMKLEKIAKTTEKKAVKYR
jgi:hypothetical protein